MEMQKQLQKILKKYHRKVAQKRYNFAPDTANHTLFYFTLYVDLKLWLSPVFFLFPTLIIEVLFV